MDARDELRERYVEYHALQRQPNVKHQRARATESRVKDELSLRALRCMRQLGAVAWTKAQLRHDEHRGTEQTDDMRAWRVESGNWQCSQWRTRAESPGNGPNANDESWRACCEKPDVVRTEAKAENESIERQ